MVPIFLDHFGLMSSLYVVEKVVNIVEYVHLDVLNVYGLYAFLEPILVKICQILAN